MMLSNKNETLFTSKLRKKQRNFYILSTALCGAETPKSRPAKFLKCGAGKGWRSLEELA
jgi:hypothetical protein